MENRMKIDEAITVAGQPTEEDLRQLSAEGFKAVVNLRAASEQDLPLSPDREGEIARQRGMEYLNIPTTMDTLSDALVDQFRKELEGLPKPVLVHCQKGKRSGALVMMDRAVKHGLSGEQTLQKAMEMGFECDNEKLASFVKNYIDRHTERP